MNLTAQQLNGTHIGKGFTCQWIEKPRQILRIHHYKTRVEVHCQHPTGRFVDLLLKPIDNITIQDEGRIGQSGNTGTFAREPFQETARKIIERTTQEEQ